MSQTAGSVNDSSAGGTAGARLKQEREKRGMTQRQVADSLHLDCWAIEALENGQFAQLGAPVHVKGHLKKYAALLEVDIDTVNVVVENGALAPRPLPLMPALRLARIKLRRRWPKFVLIALLVVLAGVTVYWLLSDNVLVQKQPVKSAPQQTEAVPTPPPEMDRPGQRP